MLKVGLLARAGWVYICVFEDVGDVLSKLLLSLTAGARRERERAQEC